MERKDILNLKIEDDRFDNDLTILGYLKKVLLMVWKEKECFDGKRPFGMSFWESDLYYPLVKANVVNGKLDEDGHIEEINEEDASKIIVECINFLFER